MSQSRRLVDEILADADLRSRLASALEKEAASTPPHWWRDRTRPFLAGLSSAAVVMLAFLIPSIQDLIDRHETRQAVARYAEIGRQLMEQRHYSAAEAAFDRAIELAGTQRLDLIDLRLQAHVRRMDEDPEWPGAVPESLTEGDFLYALALDAGPEHAKERAAVLGAYGAFLAGARRWTEAEGRLREAIAADPRSAELHVWLGNLLSDREDWPGAEQEYRKALAMEPGSVNGHYDLGLLLMQTQRPALAEAEFRAYLAARPNDAQALLRLAEALRSQGKSAQAEAARAQALRLDPNAEAAPRRAETGDDDRGGS